MSKRGAQVAAIAGGQYFHSIVLSCIDSRVAPEIVFDQGLGAMYDVVTGEVTFLDS